VQPGDEVVAFVGSVYTAASDMLAVVPVWRERGIKLHLLREGSCQEDPLGPSMTTAGATGEAMLLALRAIASLNHTRRSEAAIWGIRARRRQGFRHTRHAGYGYRWAGPKGRQRRVPDKAERVVMGKIAEWRHAGYSWYAIAANLLRQRVETSAGREWSPARVRRAYYAELRLQAAGC
jgi:hypothetical protein